jgi:hypothetical protein
MSGQRWLWRAGWILAVLAACAGCRPKTAEDLASADALAAMLQQAGASVEETAVAAPQAFDAQAAQTLQVNEGLVYVYEYDSVGQAETIAEGLRRPAEAMPWKGRVSVWHAGKLLVIYPGTDGGLLLLLNGLLGDPLTASPEAPEEPYPPGVASAISVWAEVQGVDPAGVEVVSYAAAEWLNGCLGLPDSGESCAEGTVNGWVVDLRAGDLVGTAHTDDLGLQVRLTSPE